MLLRNHRTRGMGLARETRKRAGNETRSYLQCKLGACPLNTEDVTRKCPNSSSTVPFLVQIVQQEKPLRKLEGNRLGLGMEIRFHESYNLLFV